MKLRNGMQSKGWGEVLRVLCAISGQPEEYPLVHKEIRRAVTRRFPFGVYYLIGRADLIVLAVMHGSRDPSSWKRRT
jgi:toxin ParE1/3/4